MTAPRTCCLDLDTFFVSVERLFDPSLRGKPVVVGGRPGQRGVVTAASYEVREFGVHSGMSMTEAERLAPHAIFLPTRHGVYTPYAKKVRAILERFTPVVQTASIDEFFLDFRGCERLYHRPDDRDHDATIERTVREMRETIQAELGLPASAGIGTTRSIAKIASGRAKPAGVFMVPAGGEFSFVAPLPVRKFPGIGPVAEARLVAAGILTLGQLLRLPPGALRSRYGGLADMVRTGIAGGRAGDLGRDRPAFREHDLEGVTVGSISNERTFMADVGDVQGVHDQLLALSERVAWRARKRGIRARTITLKLRTSDFHTITRSRTIAPTNADDRVFHTIIRLLNGSWDRHKAVRLVGVGLSNLVPADPQLALPFRCPQRSGPGEAIDAVRARFGYDAIRLGRAAPSSRDEPSSEWVG